MKKTLLSLLSFALLSASTLGFAAENAMMEMNLKNVTGGKEIRSIITGESAMGHASVEYSEGNFALHAEFSGLTDPDGEDFYEGWLVQKDPFKFISTGELYKKDGNYHNRFESETDYRSYDFYVLTLEPNDNDPAPADHIFEGTVIMHEAKMMNDMKKDDMMGTHNVLIDVTGENFSYSQDEIRVKKGDTVTINFESTGGYHDWVVDEFDAMTEKVSEGGKTSVTFIASKIGTFEYYCSVGKHRAAGMVGKLIVEDIEHMMKKDDMMGDEMDERKKAMMERKEAIKMKIKKRVPNLSKAKIMIILERVKKLRLKLATLNISDEKRANYNEVLDAFVEVLESDEMMMEK